jgi:hypothetical protein
MDRNVAELFGLTSLAIFGAVGAVAHGSLLFRSLLLLRPRLEAQS